tara:strand:+ start:359 stop:574 length:216 start_codon:yes stop_codon:yes gene_type:complete
MKVVKYSSSNLTPFCHILTGCEDAEKALRLQKMHTNLHKEQNPDEKNTEFWIVSKVEVTTGFTNETKQEVA